MKVRRIHPGWTLVLGILISIPPVASGQCPYEWSRGFGLPGFDVTVIRFPDMRASAVYDDGSGPALYIAGQWSEVGGYGGVAASTGLARWDGVELKPVGNGGFVGNTVYALTVFDDDGDGPHASVLVAGGDLGQIGGLPASGIAMWNGTNWLPMGTGAAGRVYSLAVYDEDGAGPNPPRLFAGGSFLTMGGITVNRIARWDGSAWSVVGSSLGANSNVLALAVHAGTLWAGGDFVNMNGISARGLARWNGTNWSALANSTPTVSALVEHDDGCGPALYIGGTFFSGAFGVNANFIARWQNGVFSSLGSGMNNAVHALASYKEGPQSRLFVGGVFSTAGGVAAPWIARWDGAGWSSVDGGVDQAVRSLCVFDDGRERELYAVGAFTNVAAGNRFAYVARWNGSRWAGLGNGIQPVSSSIIQDMITFDDGSGPAIYASGSMTWAGGWRTNHVARFDGTTWSRVGNAGIFNSAVRGLATHDDDGPGPNPPQLYGCGSFTSISGTAVRYVARFNGATWEPVGMNLTAAVETLYSFDDDGPGPHLPVLYAGGGNLLACGSGCLAAAARWDGTVWQPVITTGGLVKRFAQWDADGDGSSGQTLLAAGIPTVRCVAGAPISGCLLNGPTAGFHANDICVFDDGSGPTVFVGGWFRDSIHGDTWIRKWDAAQNAWAIIPFASPQTAPHEIRSLAVFDDGGGPKLYAAAVAAGSGLRYDLCTWDGQVSRPIGSGLNDVSGISTMVAFDDDDDGPKPPSLYLGGDFTRMDGISAWGVTRWEAPAPRITAHPQSQFCPLGQSVNLAASASGRGQLSYQWTHDGIPLAGAAGPTFSIASVSALDAGNYRVVVSDDCGSISSQAAELRVPNVAFSLVSDPIYGTGAVTVECGGTYTEYGAVATSPCGLNPTVVVDASALVTQAPDTYLVTYSAVDAVGTVLGTLSRTVIVVPPVPVADAGPDQSVPEGSVVLLDASATSNIPCGAPTYAWTQVAGTAVSLAGADTLMPAFIAPLVARGGETLTFRLVVTNGQRNEAPNGAMDEVNVAVTNINHAPVAVVEGPAAVAEFGLATLDGSDSYDPDSEPINYNWTQTSGTPVALNLLNPVRPEFFAPAVGPAGETLSFELTVDDGLDSSSACISVLVENVNHPPNANAGDDQTKAEGSTVLLDATGSSDDDGDSLTFSWAQLPGGPTVTLSGADTATPSFTAPLVAVDQTLVFRVTVDDGYGGRASDDVSITVQNTNSPPDCSLARPSVTELWPPNHRMVAVSILGVRDPENNTVMITIIDVSQDEPLNGLGDGDTAPDAVRQGGTVLLRAERAGNQPGSGGAGNGRVYRVMFQADDGQGGTCTGTVNVCVPHSKGRNALPCVDDGPNYGSLGP